MMKKVQRFGGLGGGVCVNIYAKYCMYRNERGRQAGKATLPLSFCSFLDAICTQSAVFGKPTQYYALCAIH